MDITERRAHRPASCLLALVLAALAGLSGAGAPAASAAERSVDRTDRAAVVQAYQYWYAPTLDVAAGWSGSTASCTAGAVSGAARTATLEALNYHRAMAGLDPVTENTALSADAQQAALMMSAKSALSHTPDSSWPCWTSAGSTAAGRSNLSLGTFGADAVAGQVNDLGSNNLPIVGHRRWLLLPDLGQVGMGSTSNANSMYVIHSQRSAGARDPGWVAWPGAGYFPAELIPGGASWSLSATGADFSSASVSVTKGGRAVSGVSVYPVKNGYGINSLVWSMPPVTVPASGTEDVYRVAVSGVIGGPATSYTYDVRIVSAEPTVQLKPTTRYAMKGNLVVGSTLSCSGDTWNPAPTTKTYRWYGSAPNGADNILRAIDGASASTYRLKAADAGRLWMSCTISATRAGYRSYTGSSLDVARYGPVLRTLTTATPAVRGTARVGAKLAAATGSWKPAGVSFSYRWLRDGKAIAGATRSTYTAVAADRGHRLSVRVTGAKSGYLAASATSASRPVAAGILKSAAPKVTGVTKVRSRLVAEPGTWGPGSVSLRYQWLRGGKAIRGATSRAYTLTAADRGRRLQVKVTGLKSGYTSATRTSARTAVVR